MAAFEALVWIRAAIEEVAGNVEAPISLEASREVITRTAVEEEATTRITAEEEAIGTITKEPIKITAKEANEIVVVEPFRTITQDDATRAIFEELVRIVVMDAIRTIALQAIRTIASEVASTAMAMASISSNFPIKDCPTANNFDHYRVMDSLAFTIETKAFG